MLCAFGLFAQSLDKAKEYLKANKLQDAKTEIDKAAADSKNAKVSEVWYYKSKIYTAIASNEQLKATVPDAWQQSFDALKKYTETDEKMLIAGAHLVPNAAIVDFELTMSMPARLTADTGTDSLTHAIESYVSRKANAFSDTFALTAMKTIWAELPTAFREPGNRRARESMMLAATQAGMAFSNASVALVHGMSRPLGAHFHVPHGLSNAMLLPAVTAFSVKAAESRYAECARTIGVADRSHSDAEAGNKLVDALFERMHDEVPHLKRKPSEYIRENIWYTTQPIEEPANPAHLKETIDWIGWDRLLFATDYPHWDYDDPDMVLPMPVAEEKRRDFFLNNAAKLYRQG